MEFFKINNNTITGNTLNQDISTFVDTTDSSQEDSRVEFVAAARQKTAHSYLSNS